MNCHLNVTPSQFGNYKQLIIRIIEYGKEFRTGIHITKLAMY